MPAPSPIFACACVALLLTAFAPSMALAQASPWPMAGGDPTHRGDSAGPRPPLRKVWSAPVGSRGAVAGVAVGDGKVVAVGWDRVVALAVADGDRLWEASRKPGPAGPPAIAGSVVVYGDGAALVGVALADGTEAWRRTLLSPIVGPLTAETGIVYGGTRGGDAFAFDASNGRTVWMVEAPGRVETAPAVSDGLVVVVAEDYDTGTATVLAIDASTGKVRWRFSPQGVALGSSSAAVAEGVVVLGLGDMRAHGLRLRDGEQLWTARGRAAYGSRFVPSAGGGVLLGDRLGHVARLDAETGDERWLYRVPGDLLLGGTVVLADRWVATGDGTSTVSVVDLGSGHLVWHRTIGTRRVEALAADGDQLYAAERGGPVTAFAHDPRGRLLDDPSPTTLFPLRAVGGWAVAALPLYVALLLLFRAVGAWVRDTRSEERNAEAGRE